MREPIATTIAMSVRISVRNLAIIGTYLDATGLFTTAQPSGALAFALKMFADMVVAQELAVEPTDLLQTIVMIQRLRYPKGQIEKALLREDVDEMREAARLETKEVFGSTTQRFTAIKQQIQRLKQNLTALTPEQQRQIMERAAEFDCSLDETDSAVVGMKLQKEKERMVEAARATGIISDDTRSAEEISEERAAIDAERLRREQEAIRAGIAGVGVDIAGEDDLVEFTKVAEEIVAAQPCVVNAQPALAKPGVVETQKELRKELEMNSER